MAQLEFSKFEAIIKEAIDPEIERRFNQNQSLYNQFYQSQPAKVNQSGYRIPFYNNPIEQHPWTKPDGLQSYTQLMRGELTVPHMPNDCDECHDAFEEQVKVARSLGMRGLGRKSATTLAPQMSRIVGWLRWYSETQEQAA